MIEGPRSGRPKNMWIRSGSATLVQGIENRWLLPLFIWNWISHPLPMYLGEDTSSLIFSPSSVLVFSSFQSKNIRPSKEIRMKFGGQIQCCGSGYGIRNRFFRISDTGSQRTVGQLIFSPPLLLLLLDLGSEIRNPGWVKIWIRDPV